MKKLLYFIFTILLFLPLSIKAANIPGGYINGYQFNGSLGGIKNNGSIPSIYSGRYTLGTGSIITSAPIRFPSNFQVGDNRSRTYIFNVKLDINNDNYYSLLNFGQNRIYQGFEFAVSKNKGAFFYDGKNRTYFDFNYSSDFGIYVITYDALSRKIDIYKDGLLLKSIINGYDLNTYNNNGQFGYGFNKELDYIYSYSKPLSKHEVQNISNKKTVFTVLPIAELVNLSNERSVNFTFSGVTDTDEFNTFDFMYSYDNVNFTSFGKTLTGALNNHSENFSLDLYNVSHGPFSMYFKINDGLVDSEVIEVKMEKNINLSEPMVTINSETIDPNSSSKRYTLIAEYGEKFYSITSGTTCDNSLEFQPYKALDFNVYSFNGKKVCYKVTYGRNQELYKLSEEISGIIGIMDHGRGDVFSTYKDWRNSTQVKVGDNTLAFLKMMSTSSKTGNSAASKSYPSSLIDINGDGLVDMLYSSYDKRVENRFHEGGHYEYWIYTYKYAIMINNGDYTFTPVYRCLQEDGKYYGNCAE